MSSNRWLRPKSGIRKRHTYKATDRVTGEVNQAAVAAFNDSKRRRVVKLKEGTRVIYKHLAQ